ncbi:hypothetical protein LJR225_000447 [Phenylobacterium sp. LjRoot225]|uniref:hypothetical protein n=1 Tax=Phenylobacterium sp. LjRoot225 TaxID=3342285 RepID=UPI003ECF30FA
MKTSPRMTMTGVPLGGPLPVDILSPNLELIAAFASPLEAYRYAALIYQPQFVPRLRRAQDGAIIVFRPQAGVSALTAWLEAA